MHIALFGGSFDPPHLGHQLVARQIIEHKVAGEVWYVPVGQHEFGEVFSGSKHLLPARDRLAMLRLVESDKIKVSTFETDRNRPSFTHTTLREMKANYPQHVFSWVIGSDQLPNFLKWDCESCLSCASSMLQEFRFFVYPRKGFEMAPLLPGMIALSGEEVGFSSTQIRALRKDHLVASEIPKSVGSALSNITGLVDPAVEDYIQSQALYKVS